MIPNYTLTKPSQPQNIANTCGPDRFGLIMTECRVRGSGDRKLQFGLRLNLDKFCHFYIKYTTFLVTSTC